ncbi:unnamed protein product [Clonostachys rosea]|uniref:CSC1/OSCA1-like 7TM region domain-containing protein n=1 Tax=Bionectria ochroleuca TaxID=29856 RepID=A0ABY6UEI2_BIOOC|nr:unnamed protein product [Clonostachys rosea]
MASSVINPSYTFDNPATTLNVTSCLENAQETIDFHKAFFNLGIVLLTDFYFPPWLIFPLLLCFCLLGRAGIKARKLGWMLQKDDEVFNELACMTSGMAYCVIPMAGDRLLGPLTTGSPSLETIMWWVVMLVSAAVYWSVLRRVKTLYYRFATRRIPGMYWLPQNGAKRKFDPWWSQLLQFAMPLYICALAYSVLPVMGEVVRKCNLELPHCEFDGEWTF